MKILFYSTAFSPELTATGKYNGEMLEWLADKGHKVEIITTMPFYPEWEVHASYKGKWWHTETKENITIYRCPIYVPKKVTGLTRVLHEVSFFFSSLFFWIPCFFRKYDLVMAVCPPLQIGILPYIYSKIHKIPFIFHIQDLQVDAAESLEMIKNNYLFNILKKIEKFLFTRATYVSSISLGMKRKILEKGVKEKNYYMLENWVDIDAISIQEKDYDFKSKIGLAKDDIVVLYSGNIGKKQGLEVLLKASVKLKENSQINVVISGDGAEKEDLINKAKILDLNNVLFLPIQPVDDFKKLLSIADIHLILQKKSAADLVMPSKLTTILACGGLSIITAEKSSSLYQTIQENNIGILIEPENEYALTQGIEETILNGQLNTDKKKNARKYAEKNLSKEIILNNFSTFIENL